MKLSVTKRDPTRGLDLQYGGTSKYIETAEACHARATRVDYLFSTIRADKMESRQMSEPREYTEVEHPYAVLSKPSRAEKRTQYRDKMEVKFGHHTPMVMNRLEGRMAVFVCGYCGRGMKNREERFKPNEHEFPLLREGAKPMCIGRGVYLERTLRQKLQLVIDLSNKSVDYKIATSYSEQKSHAPAPTNIVGIAEQKMVCEFCNRVWRLGTIRTGFYDSVREYYGWPKDWRKLREKLVAVCHGDRLLFEKPKAITARSNSVYSNSAATPIDAQAASMLRTVSTNTAPKYTSADSAPVIAYSEAELQDFYCQTKGLPLKAQRRVGIDYYDDSCGWLEFTTKGIVELKDVTKYLKQAGSTPYKVVFADGIPPRPESLEILSLLKVRWELFCPQNN